MKHKRFLCPDTMIEGELEDDTPLMGWIGYLRISIFIPYSRSLKDRRQVLNRIMHKVRNNFNASIAQRPTDKWKNCELAFVCVNYTKNYANKAIEQIENSIRLNNDIQILEVEKGII